MATYLGQQEVEEALHDWLKAITLSILGDGDGEWDNSIAVGSTTEEIALGYCEVRNYEPDSVMCMCQQSCLVSYGLVHMLLSACCCFLDMATERPLRCMP